MLYNRVCELMHLEEKDYFGLTFINNENTRVSLDCFFFELNLFNHLNI